MIPRLLHTSWDLPTLTTVSHCGVSYSDLAQSSGATFAADGLQ